MFYPTPTGYLERSVSFCDNHPLLLFLQLFGCRNLEGMLEIIKIILQIQFLNEFDQSFGSFHITLF
jgi:hypothetical protein